MEYILNDVCFMSIETVHHVIADTEGYAKRMGAENVDDFIEKVRGEDKEYADFIHRSYYGAKEILSRLNDDWGGSSDNDLSK